MAAARGQLALVTGVCLIVMAGTQMMRAFQIHKDAKTTLETLNVVAESAAALPRNVAPIIHRRIVPATPALSEFCWGT